MPPLFIYASAFLAGVYTLPGVPVEAAAAFAAAAVALSALGKASAGRVALAASAFLVGSSLHGEGVGSKGTLEPGVVVGRVETCTRAGAVVSSGGCRSWVSGRRMADGCMEGDSIVALLARQRGRLVCLCSEATPPRDPATVVRRCAVALWRARIDSPLASSLVSALVAGDRSGMPGVVRNAFRLSGVTHILSVSGFHVGVVAGAAFLLSRRLAGRRMLSAIPAVLLVWAYVAVTGGRPPAVRAGFMSSAALLGSVAGVRPHPLTLWSLAVFAVTALEPGAPFDAGAQMSFAAVLALILTRRGDPAAGGHLLSGIHSGICVTVAVAPLVQRWYGSFQPVSPLATMLSVPPTIVCMVLGCACLLPAVWPPFAMLEEWACFLWLSMLELLAVVGSIRIEGPAAAAAWVVASAWLLLSSRWWGYPRGLGGWGRGRRKPAVSSSNRGRR